MARSQPQTAPRDAREDEQDPPEGRPLEASMPTTQEQVRVLLAQRDELLIRCRLLEEENEALKDVLASRDESAKTIAEATATGARIEVESLPRVALCNVAGSGHRTIRPGEELSPAECRGLTRGEHWEHGIPQSAGASA